MALSTAGRADQDRDGADRRRARASTRSTTSRRKRAQEVAFLLAKLRLEKYFTRRRGRRRKPWLFPQLLGIARRWLAECVVCKDDGFPQLLLLVEYAHNAADSIYRAIVAGDAGEKRLHADPAALRHVGSTRYVDFDTTRPSCATDAEKCHISHVVCDTDSWEQKMAQTLEDMAEVVALREEPEPRLHDPVHVRRRGSTATCPTSSSACGRRRTPDSDRST